MALSRLDATALLWRLQLEGAEREQGTNGEMTRQVGLEACEAATALRTSAGTGETSEV